MVRHKIYRLVGGQSDYKITGIVVNNPCKGHFNVEDRFGNKKMLYVNQALYTTDKELLHNIISKAKITEVRPNEYKARFKVPSYIELTDVVPEVSTGPHYLCKVNRNNYDKLENKESFKGFHYSYRYVTDTLPKYLESIGAHTLFYQKTDKYVIFPNLMNYPLRKEDVDIFGSLEDIWDKYEFLSRLEFYCMFIDDDRLINLNDILKKFTQEQIKQIVDDGNTSLKTFLRDLLGKEPDEFMYTVYYSRDYNKKYITAKLKVFNSYTGTEYTSFIENQRWIKYSMLANNYNLQFVKRFYEASEYTDSFCKGVDPFYDYVKLQEAGGKIEILGTEFKVLNYHYQYDLTEKPYCMNSILVKTKDEKYYNVLISLGTYATILRTSKHDSDLHKIPTVQHIKKIIDSRAIISTGLSELYIGETDAYCWIKIKEISSDSKLPFTVPYLESADAYKGFLDKINRSVFSNFEAIQLILLSLVDTDIVKGKAIELLKKYEMLRLLKVIADAEYSNNRRFVIVHKTDVAVEKMDTVDSYVLWYLPNIKIRTSKEDEFVKFLNTFFSKFTAKDYYTNILSEVYKQQIHELTTFYDLYNRPDYVHNVRRLTNTDRLEIDQVLKDFTFKKYGSDEESYVFSNPYHYWVHYPNYTYYNTFHIQIARITSFESTNPYMLQRKSFRYEANSGRIFNWNEVKNIDFTNADIVCEYFFSLKIGEKLNEEIVKRAMKYHSDDVTTDIINRLDYLNAVLERSQ